MIQSEKQNTVLKGGDRISGELVIRFEDIPLDDFLRYRGTIRGITGFGRIGISHTVINERALVTENNLEKRPATATDAYPALNPENPARQQPTKPREKRRQPDHTWIRGTAASFLMTLNVPEAEVLPHYHAKFRKTRFTDNQIIETWRKYQTKKKS